MDTLSQYKRLQERKAQVTQEIIAREAGDVIAPDDEFDHLAWLHHERTQLLEQQGDLEGQITVEDAV